MVNRTSSKLKTDVIKVKRQAMELEKMSVMHTSNKAFVSRLQKKYIQYEKFLSMAKETNRPLPEDLQ